MDARLCCVAACAMTLVTGASEMWWREGASAGGRLPHCMANGLKVAQPERFIEDPESLGDGDAASAKARIKRELRSSREMAAPGAPAYVSAIELPIPTPEPTSGILALLGWSVLALRRRTGLEKQ